MNNDSRIKVKLYGVDGSEWHISGEGRGQEGVAMASEPTGLYDAPVTTLWESTARQVGGTFRDIRYDARDVNLEVDISATAQDDWETVDYKWRRALSYEKPARLEVTTRYGTRALNVQMWNAPDYKESPLPGQVRTNAKMNLYLRAGNPLWQERVDSAEFTFDGTNYTGEVIVDNPTDQPQALEWVVRSPASIILPDYDFKSEKTTDRLITMPFQPLGTDVLITTDLSKEQVVCPTTPNYWAKMRGQFFLHSVPPFTDATALPVAINPLPWLTTAMAALGLPITIPPQWLYGIAQGMAVVLKGTPPDTVLSWAPETLAGKIDGVIDTLTPEFAELVADEVRQKFTIPTMGELITKAYGSVNTMAGAGIKCYMSRQWTRPWGR